MSKNKEAVSNAGEEEVNFLKMVRLTRDDTRRQAESMFTTSHQNRDRDLKLLDKLFVQSPLALHVRPNLAKQASAEQWDQYEKIKVAYNTFHFFEEGNHLTSAQKKYPELLKVSKVRPAVTPQKTKSNATGSTADGNLTSGAAS